MMIVTVARGISMACALHSKSMIRHDKVILSKKMAEDDDGPQYFEETRNAFM